MVTHLKRGLGSLHMWCIASGAMISSGLFILPGLAHARAGPAVIFSYLLAGLLAGTGLLSMAELATAMPKAGGDYFFITRGMGCAVGTVAGLLNWFSLSLKSAFALVGMVAFMRLVWDVSEAGRLAAGLVFCAGFVVVNLVGVKGAARLQVGLVIALVGLLALYVLRGLPAVSVQRLEPFAPFGVRAVFSTAGFVFISYGGLIKIASLSEEVKKPGRTVPLALMLSLVVVGLLYVLVVYVTCGVLDEEKLRVSLMPLTDGARAFMGSRGAFALSVAAILAFLTTANAGIMAASRYLLAMSRDRLLPDVLGRIGMRTGTPHVSILITGAVIAAALFVPLNTLVEAASTVLILSFMLSILTVIVLRESRVQNYRPRFRAPLYPFVQILGLFGLAFVIFEMGEEAFLLAAAMVGLGLTAYWTYGRARVRRESALLHLVQRVTARELVTGSLEAELKQIIRERDDIVLDRFDRIIESCIVLDLDRFESAEEFFGLVAEKLSPRIDVDRRTLLDALLARERESSTVLGENLAIPHVIVAGEHKSDILIARSREGITFSPEGPPVHAVFVLAGTRDERNFHLQALSAIAQVVQDPSFARRWMAARGEQGLRDAVLLGERRRY